MFSGYFAACEEKIQESPFPHERFVTDTSD